jgi:hypothetical protein
VIPEAKTEQETSQQQPVQQPQQSSNDQSQAEQQSAEQTTPSSTTTESQPQTDAPLDEQTMPPPPPQQQNAYLSIPLQMMMAALENRLSQEPDGMVETTSESNIAEEQTTEELPPQIVQMVQVQPSKPEVKKLPIINRSADYDFSYSVNDNFSGDIKSQSETRRGNTVSGTYSLIDADGFRRIVDYQADDKNGFTAQIRREPVYKSINLNPIVAPPSTVIFPSDDENVLRYVAPVFTSVSQIRSASDDELPQQFDSQYVYSLPSDETYYY